MTSEVSRDFACRFKISQHIVEELFSISKFITAFSLNFILCIIKVGVAFRLNVTALVQRFKLFKEECNGRTVKDKVVEIRKQIYRLFSFCNRDSEQRCFHKIVRFYKILFVGFSKIKANVNRDGLTLDGINRQLALLDTRLEKYLHQLNENDLVETAHEQLSELSDELGVESSLLEKIARLSQQVEELQAEKQRMLDEGSKRRILAI